MVSERELEQFLVESGLWNGNRRQSHNFVLSPDTLELSLEQVDDLIALGDAVRSCLLGISGIAYLASREGKTTTRLLQSLNRIFRTGVPKMYHDLLNLRPHEIPLSVKVDLLIDQESGRFRIAEIDAHNKHGLGYSTLLRNVRDFVDPKSSGFTGVVRALLTVLQKHFGFMLDDELVMVYGDQERFYLPEFEILQREIASHGISMQVINEVEVDGELIMKWDRDGVKRVFFDIPVMYKNQQLVEFLQHWYEQARFGFLIPPKPFLGSKAVLAILRNDHDNEELESLLREYIPGESLEVIRGFISPTYLVNNKGVLKMPSHLDVSSYVMKEVVSGGMKGTVFGSDVGFASQYERTLRTNYVHVLQREIENKPLWLAYFENGEIRYTNWYARVTAFFVDGVIGDLDVTARQDKKIHGAKDCIQIGAKYGEEVLEAMKMK